MRGSWDAYCVFYGLGFIGYIACPEEESRTNLCVDSLWQALAVDGTHASFFPHFFLIPRCL